MTAEANARDTTPVWSAWAEGRHDRRRRVCRELSNSDQIIKFENGRDGSAAENRTIMRETSFLRARHHPRLVRLGGGSA